MSHEPKNWTPSLQVAEEASTSKLLMVSHMRGGRAQKKDPPWSDLPLVLALKQKKTSFKDFNVTRSYHSEGITICCRQYYSSSHYVVRMILLCCGLK